MNATLRTPTAADYEVIASWVPDAKACERWAGPQLRYPFIAAELPRLLAMPDASSFCLREGDDTPIGFGQFWVKAPGFVHLGRIIVSPHERGRGLGRQLCELLVAKAARLTKAKTITLRVYKDNASAIAIYSSLGFMVVESQSTEEAWAMEAKTDVDVS
jgi:ribosomal protein S18 acetylase RimI-like enzyme